jgi:hypothetical protein
VIVLGVTYKQIATITVSTATAANMEFTNIPQTFTDLILHTSARTDRATILVDGIKMSINGSSANQTNILLLGSGFNVTTEPQTVFSAGVATTTASTSSTFGNSVCYIPNYAGNTNKSGSADGVNENNDTAAFQALFANLWSNTAAITSLTLAPNAGTNFVQYSSATLYGISKS